MRPDFLIVGAPKCGTTALWRYLAQHPQVFMAARKDLHFFGSDVEITRRSRPSLAQYEAHFASARGARRVGEASVWYLYSRRAAREIAAYDPAMRIVVALRDPVEAMYALHQQLVRNGLGDEDLERFQDALDAEPDRRAARRIPSGAAFPEALLYREVVRFGAQVARYLDVFPREQVHIVTLERLRAAPEATGAALLAFLGLDRSPGAGIEPANRNRVVRRPALRKLVRATPDAVKRVIPTPLRTRVRRTVRALTFAVAERPALPPELERSLRAELADDVARLETLLGWDLTAWRARPAEHRAA